jgi:hypothetical protein
MARPRAWVAPIIDVVRKVLVGVATLFIVTAALTRVAEAKGVSRFQCDCEPDCCCKRGVSSFFRWVTPRRSHHLGASSKEKVIPAEEQ